MTVGVDQAITLPVAVPSLRFTKADAAIPPRTTWSVVCVLGRKIMPVFAGKLFRVHGKDLVVRVVVFSQGHRAKMPGVYAKRVLAFVVDQIARWDWFNEVSIRPAMRKFHWQSTPWIKPRVTPARDASGPLPAPVRGDFVFLSKALRGLPGLGGHLTCPFVAGVFPMIEYNGCHGDPLNPILSVDHIRQLMPLVEVPA